MGSELGIKCMTWLVGQDGGRVAGVWNRVVNWVRKLVISGLLTRWQVYQIVTSSKVLGSPSVESTGTLFVLRLMQTQIKSKR